MHKNKGIQCIWQNYVPQVWIQSPSAVSCKRNRKLPTQHVMILLYINKDMFLRRTQSHKIYIDYVLILLRSLRRIVIVGERSSGCSYTILTIITTTRSQLAMFLVMLINIRDLAHIFSIIRSKTTCDLQRLLSLSTNTFKRIIELRCVFTYSILV